MREQTVADLLQARLDVLAKWTAQQDAQVRAGILGTDAVHQARVHVYQNELRQPYGKKERRMLAERWLASARWAEQNALHHLSLGTQDMAAIHEHTLMRLEAEIALAQAK